MKNGASLKVPAHRFGAAEIHAALTGGDFSLSAITEKTASWSQLGLDWSEAVATLQQTQGDVQYEQLECLGLDFNREEVVATVHLKRAFGYSSRLCEPGSYEYVAFWADLDDTCRWTYLGTASINVHDIPAIPADGLRYSAVYPVDLTHHRRTCEEPRVARVRAVLSWSIPPSTSNPDALPFWGNRLDTHVQIKPGPVIPVGEVRAVIGILGGVPSDKIDQFSGLTLGDATYALNGRSVDSLGRACPFAGRIVVQGPAYPGYRYRVQVRKVGDLAWTTVATTMNLSDVTGTITTKQVADANGTFAFLNPALNIDRTLAWWDSAGDGLYTVKLDIEDPAAPGSFLPGKDIKLIQLFNSNPTVADPISITLDFGNCGIFSLDGGVLSGRFVADFQFFGSYSLSTLPFPPKSLTPSSGTTPTPPPIPPLPGLSFTLDTTGMKVCGYVLELVASDRVVLDSWQSGRSYSTSAGFCLT